MVFTQNQVSTVATGPHAHVHPLDRDELHHLHMRPGITNTTALSKLLRLTYCSHFNYDFAVNDSKTRCF